MHRVLEHIDKQLDQPLDLETLAKVAHFSPFHFHRLFSAWMGETLGDYLRRRRVEIAATRLVSQPRVRVLLVALSVGFGSAEAFARAFKTRFGCSPTLWRQQQSALRPGLQLDSRIMFEYYPEDSSFDPATGVFDCKLCVPVVPL